MSMMRNTLLAVVLLASVTWTVKLLLPAVVGVPVRAPLGESDRPAGRLPVKAKLYGALPPVADTVAEYARVA